MVEGVIRSHIVLFLVAKFFSGESRCRGQVAIFVFFGSGLVFVRSGGRKGDVFYILWIVVEFLLRSLFIVEADMFLGFPGIVALIIALPLDQELLVI
jgi:hypothetical protein